MMLNSKVLQLIAESQTETVKIKYKSRKCLSLLRSGMSSPQTYCPVSSYDTVFLPPHWLELCSIKDLEYSLLLCNTYAKIGMTRDYRPCARFMQFMKLSVGGKKKTRP